MRKEKRIATIIIASVLFPLHSLATCMGIANTQTNLTIQKNKTLREIKDKEREILSEITLFSKVLSQRIEVNKKEIAMLEKIILVKTFELQSSKKNNK